MSISVHAQVHPTAIVYPNVIIEDDVVIGPFCVIGGPPEHKEFYDGQESKGVLIGSGARIFSHVTIDAGTRIRTEVHGSVFQKGHVAHDCFIGPSATVGGQSSLAGHTQVLEGATVSGHSCTFQRTVIGAYSFVAGNSYVTKNVPTAERWGGSRLAFLGLNEVGLQRAGMTYEGCIEKFRGEYDRRVAAANL